MKRMIKALLHLDDRFSNIFYYKGYTKNIHYIEKNRLYIRGLFK